MVKNVEDALLFKEPFHVPAKVRKERKMEGQNVTVMKNLTALQSQVTNINMNNRVLAYGNFTWEVFRVSRL